MKTSLIPLAFLVLLLSSCKKDIEKIIVEALNRPPEEFKVTVVNRLTNTALLEWEEAKDYDGDVVTYSIELPGFPITQGLKTTSYQLSGLFGTLTYKGQVIATDAKGNKRSADFTLTPYSEQIIISAGYGGGVMSYDAAGKFSWKLGERVLNIPAISNDTLFVGTDDHEFYAANIANGKILWSKPFTQLSGTSTLYNKGIVFFSVTNQIIALNAKDGTTLWTLNKPASRNLIASEGLLFAITNTGLVAIDAKTGIIKWTRAQVLESQSMPTVKNGIVYYAYGKSLFAIDAKTGLDKWKYTTPGTILLFGHLSAPTIYDNMIYFPVEIDNGYDGLQHLAFAVDLTQGKLLWQTKLATYKSVGALSVDATGVYAASSSEMFKLNRSNGT